jgi:ribose transport system substrate-binding protein
MRVRAAVAFFLAGLAVFCGPGCTKAPESTPTATGGGATTAPRTVRIGMVAKSEENDVFQAAKQGALDAAKELGPQYGVTVEIDWRTPPKEDSQAQAQAISSLANEKVDGMTVSCTDANFLKGAINDAVDKGVPVVCFDSDSPDSKRFCVYGTDDFQQGQLIMVELAKLMNDTGNIAILAGNPGGTNLQKRVAGVTTELAKHPNMHLVDKGVINHAEDPAAAAEAIKQAMAAHPDQIQGWAMVGGWPLFTSNALDWAPGSVKVVAGDALPKELEYLKDGHVQVLVAQDCYGWGYKTVKILLDKIVKNQDPADAKNGKIADPQTRVTKDGDAANGVKSVAEFSSNWDKWLPKK